MCRNATAAQSVNSGLGLDVFDVVGEREYVDRAVVDLHPPARSAPTVEPADGMLHPVGVVALGIVFLHVRAAAFFAVGGAVHSDDRLGKEVVELERLDQVAVPDKAAVG